MFKNTKIINKKEYWQKHMLKYEQSELSQKEYCKQNKLVYETFKNWRKKLSKISKDELIKIPLETKKDIFSKSATLEIIINDQLRIKIPEDYNPETLKSLLEALGVIKC
jgi:hypothetical protein